MDKLARRNFVKYAVGATLASAAPSIAQVSRDISQMPLVVDLIGPMAFRKSKDKDIVEVWLPKLEGSGKKHEAGIGTSVTSIVLEHKDYAITGTTAATGDPLPYLTANCSVYGAKPRDYSATDRYIYLTLPKPKAMVALAPVRAKIYATGSAPPASSSPYAVGLRFLYDHAGKPNLSSVGDIPFDAAPGELQLNMSIGYAPYDYHDTGHAEAMYAFHQLSILFPDLDLQVAIDEPSDKRSFWDKGDVKRALLGGPLHNCKAPLILLK